jgi:hypothetical protein
MGHLASPAAADLPALDAFSMAPPACPDVLCQDALCRVPRRGKVPGVGTQWRGNPISPALVKIEH